MLAFVGKLTHFKIYAIVALEATLCAVYYALLQAGVPCANPQMLFFANGVIRDLHYVILMLIAASYYIALNENNQVSHNGRFLPPLFIAVAFNLIRLTVVKGLGIRPWQDVNLVSQVVIFVFFLTCLELQKYGTKSLFARMISYASDMTYSLYLLHLSIGIFLLSVLRNKVSNQYVLVLLVMLIISAMSLVCYHGIEKRCRYRKPTPTPTPSHT